MKILVLTNMWPIPANPAFGTFVAEQVAGLRRRGVGVDVLFVNGKASTLNYGWGYPRLWRALAGQRYDLIHAHYVFSGLIARGQSGTPVVVSFHGAGEMVGVQGTLCRWLAPLVDGVTVTSPEHHAQLGYAPARIVPCGVDLGLFEPGEKQAARARLGLPLDREVVLYCGASRPEKRVPLLEAAVRRLQQGRPAAHFVAAMGRPHEEVPLWMAAADALALVSDYEGSPVVIKEAMAMNLPIVATPVGDIPDLFGGLPGHFLVRQDEAEIAAALGHALDHGPTSGRAAIARLSLEGTLDGVLALYADVLARTADDRRRTTADRRRTTDDGRPLTTGSVPTPHSPLSNHQSPSRLLVVLGEGGHTTEMVRLVELLGPDYDYHYLLVAEDDQSAGKIGRAGPLHRVPRPRHDPGKRHHPLRDPWLALRCFVAALPLLWRLRPAAVLTTGPWVGVVVGLAARLLGIRLIFIETGSRVTTLSATGKAMRWLADDFFVQWESLRARVPGAHYAGRLW